MIRLIRGMLFMHSMLRCTGGDLCHRRDATNAPLGIEPGASDRVTSEQELAQLLRPPRGLGITFPRGDDRDLPQDVPLAAEGVGCLDSGVCGEEFEDTA